jgi:ubiquinone/menaquinone biosynthesis C-methylase UbiE
MSNRYVCGFHRLPLREQGEAAVCASCSEPYPIRDGIWLLDPVQRPDRTAFDGQAAEEPTPHDGAKAAAHLAAAGVETLRGATILDVGCGLGDLSHGLACSPKVLDSEVYAFDHSLESLRRATASVRPENRNRVYFSAQDTSNLYFPDQCFDLVFGSAVLHHVLEYESFLGEIFRILKPDGTAVFSEPFFEGMFWPAVLLTNAIDELGVKPDAPELGMARFIVDLVSLVGHSDGKREALATLTDKHYFQEGTVRAAAWNAGFRAVEFSNLAANDFYVGWLEHFLNIYQVRHVGVRAIALRYYRRVCEIAGGRLPSLVSHFKYIVLQRGSSGPARVLPAGSSVEQ